MTLIAFLGSTAGRWLRGIVGAALAVAAFALGGWWLLLLVPAALFLASGIFDFCVLAPLAGLPVGGRALREAARGAH